MSKVTKDKKQPAPASEKRAPSAKPKLESMQDGSKTPADSKLVTRSVTQEDVGEPVNKDPPTEDEMIDILIAIEDNLNEIQTLYDSMHLEDSKMHRKASKD